MHNPIIATCAKNKNPRNPLLRPISQVMMTIDVTIINIPARLHQKHNSLVTYSSNTFCYIVYS